MIQSFEEQGTAKLSLWELFRVLIAPGFHLPRQIFLPLLAQEFGRALMKFRIVRQPIERIPSTLEVSGFLRNGYSSLRTYNSPTVMVPLPERANPRVERILCG